MEFQSARGELTYKYWTRNSSVAYTAHYASEPATAMLTQARLDKCPGPLPCAKRQKLAVAQ